MTCRSPPSPLTCPQPLYPSPASLFSENRPSTLYLRALAHAISCQALSVSTAEPLTPGFLLRSHPATHLLSRPFQDPSTCFLGELLLPASLQLIKRWGAREAASKANKRSPAYRTPPGKSSLYLVLVLGGSRAHRGRLLFLGVVSCCLPVLLRRLGCLGCSTIGPLEETDDPNPKS